MTAAAANMTKSLSGNRKATKQEKEELKDAAELADSGIHKCQTRQSNAVQTLKPKKPWLVLAPNLGFGFVFSECTPLNLI